MITILPASLPRRCDLTPRQFLPGLVLLGGIVVIFFLFSPFLSQWLVAVPFVICLALVWADYSQWRSWRGAWQTLASTTDLKVCDLPRNFPWGFSDACVQGKYRGYQVTLSCPPFPWGQARGLRQYTLITSRRQIEGTEQGHSRGTASSQILQRRFLSWRWRSSLSQSDGMEFDRLFFVQHQGQTPVFPDDLRPFLVDLAKHGRFETLEISKAELAYRERDRISDAAYLQAVLDRLVFLLEVLSCEDQPGSRD